RRGEAYDLVVAYDVSPSLRVDAVVVRVRAPVVGVDERPDEAALEDVITEVEVLLVGLRAEPELHVPGVHPAPVVALRTRPLEAQRPGRVLQRQALDVHEAAVDLEHVARRAAAAVEDGTLLARAADDDRIVRRPARAQSVGDRVRVLRVGEHYSQL